MALKQSVTDRPGHQGDWALRCMAIAEGLLGRSVIQRPASSWSEYLRRLMGFEYRKAALAG
ncbi:hypothetical protein MPNT_210002 [Candidatus Methylacidithermus pantelleriae]|uniref:Uncharacterized protein n=1 Tax=Candidatus Methylacidithermus pantelleriae TaxID=2744239 RepID=A0A8J2FSK5_9BACT|nr:hypothetical protein MPNT_210002 [Candidatus Methylacidithermus pantelleriae]